MMPLCSQELVESEKVRSELLHVNAQLLAQLQQCERDSAQHAQVREMLSLRRTLQSRHSGHFSLRGLFREIVRF